MEQNVIEILKTSPTMMVLLVMSVVVFSAIVERFLFLAGCSVKDADELILKLKHMLSNKSYSEAISLCEEYRKPLFNVIKAGVMNRQMPKADVEDLMVSTRLEEKVKMEKLLMFIGSMGTICPLMGLLGTVAGLSSAFSALALSGSAGPSVVAAGISEALFATIMGLAIAIPTVMSYNYLMGVTRKLNSEMEINIKRTMVWLYAE